MHDAWDVGDGLLEARDRLPIPLAHGDEHDRCECLPDGGGVDDRTVTADRSGALQLAQPPVARGDAEVHPGRELGECQATVSLKFSKDFSIQVVHVEEFTPMSHVGSALGKVVAPFQAYWSSIMAASSVAAFMGVSLLLVLVPGADWAYAISSGLRGGSPIPAVGGLLIGYAGHTLAVMAGVAAVLAKNPAVLTVLTAAGALYLVWLGVVTVYKPATVEACADAPVRSARARLLTGAGISGLNPKALVLFLALLPQFTDRSGDLSLPLQIGVLGLTHIFNCAVVYTCVALLARSVLRTRPRVGPAHQAQGRPCRGLRVRHRDDRHRSRVVRGAAALLIDRQEGTDVRPS